LVLSVCLDISVMSRGDPVRFSVDSFAQRDFEVWIHGVAYIPVGGTLVSFGVSFNGQLEPFDFVLKGEDCEMTDVLAILDGLDQTGSDVTEGSGVDERVGGEYSFHGMG